MHAKGWWSDPSQSDGYSLYVTRLETFPPVGWEVPSSAEYKEIIDVMIANDVTGSSIGKAFLQGGVLGYDCLKFESGSNIVDYWTSDPGDSPGMVRFDIGNGAVSMIAADKSAITKNQFDRNIGKHNPVRFIKRQ